MADPKRQSDGLLVAGLTVGTCGGDNAIAAAEHDWAPPGRERLVLGHESSGRVRTAPPGSASTTGAPGRPCW